MAGRLSPSNEMKPIAKDESDDKRLRKAERDAQEVANHRSSARRGRGGMRGRFAPYSPMFHVQPRFPFRPVGPFRAMNPWSQVL